MSRHASITPQLLTPHVGAVLTCGLAPYGKPYRARWRS